MVSLSALSYFMPILSFLLVFIIVYALLAKTKLLGENKVVHLLISFILAIFFVMNVSLVDFVSFSSAWFVVFIVCVFLILLLIAFTHGKIDVVMNKYVAWVILVVLIIFFIVSSAFTFNWAVNWPELWNGVYSDWFGMIILLIIAGVVSWIIAKK